MNCIVLECADLGQIGGIETGRSDFTWKIPKPQQENLTLMKPTGKTLAPKSLLSTQP